jgi:hypothetical protein
MQIQLPHVPPIIVHWLMEEKPFYEAWDFWVSIGTLALAGVTFWLAWETRRMREDSKKAIEASHKSADAATASVEVSQESMRRTLRAYVTVESCKPGMQDNRKIPRAIELVFCNTGQTPAIAHELFSHFLVMDHWPLKAFDPAGSEYRRWPRGDIGRDQPLRFWEEHYAGEDDLNAIHKHEKHYVIYGALQYRDMFSKDIRMTEFCYAWDARNQYFVPVGPMNRVS